MINPNFKNLAENLIIIIVVGGLCGSIGYKAGYNGATAANKQVLEQLTPTIREAILKETTKIENKIALKIDKIKKSDSIQINVNQQPANDIKQQKIEVVKDTVFEKKRSWFGRTFFKNKN